MTSKSNFEKHAYEWQPRYLLFPRVGKTIDRDGLHTRLIWPGRYFVRRSRTLAQWLYRSRSE